MKPQTKAFTLIALLVVIAKPGANRRANVHRLPRTTGDAADFDQSYTATGQQDAWSCLPGQQHNRGANLAFADGLVEHWRWRWGRLGGIYDVPSGYYPLANADDRYDFQRVEDHSPKPR